MLIYITYNPERWIKLTIAIIMEVYLGTLFMSSNECLILRDACWPSRVGLAVIKGDFVVYMLLLMLVGPEIMGMQRGVPVLAATWAILEVLFESWVAPLNY